MSISLNFFNKDILNNENVFIITFVTVFIVSIFIGLITRKFFFKYACKSLNINKKNPHINEILLKSKIIRYISYLIPIVITHVFCYKLRIFDTPLSNLISSQYLWIFKIIYKISISSIIIGAINFVSLYYEHKKYSKKLSIQSFIQLSKLIIYLIALILIISDIMNLSILHILTGISAITAVILFIFKDTILGLIASIQIVINDSIRLDDWIEINKYKINGIVTEISLLNIKVISFNNSIVSIPTRFILSESIVNWRQMKELGERRVKESTIIDPSSIKLYKNTNITNLNVLYKKIYEHLKSHKHICKHKVILVRQLQQSHAGLPIELIFFTNTVDSNSYEKIKSEIFEYLYITLDMLEIQVCRPTR